MLRLGINPNAVPGAAASFIPITLAGGHYFNLETGEYRAFNGTPAIMAGLNNPRQNVGSGNANCGCSNVVKEMDLTILTGNKL